MFEAVETMLTRFKKSKQTYKYTTDIMHEFHLIQWLKPKQGQQAKVEIRNLHDGKWRCSNNPK
jgi:hypothetical protein